MADYLQTLALRGAGLPPDDRAVLVAPRPRARFEPGDAATSQAPRELEESEELSGVREADRALAARPRTAAPAPGPSRAAPRAPGAAASRPAATPGGRRGSPARGRQEAVRLEPEPAPAGHVAAPAAERPVPPTAGRGPAVESVPRATVSARVASSRTTRPAPEGARETPPAGERRPAGEAAGPAAPVPPAQRRSPIAAGPEAAEPVEGGEATSAELGLGEPEPALEITPSDRTAGPPPLPGTQPPAMGWLTPRGPEPREPVSVSPTIQVTIGRIEVEIAPPPSPPAAARARPEPTRGFEAYARARRGRPR